MSTHMATTIVGMSQRPCNVCVRVTKWLPVVFIIVVVVWSYYAYVVELALRSVNTYTESVLYVCCYHVLLVMFLWAYYQTVVTPVRTVPPQFKLEYSDLVRFDSCEDSREQVAILENHVSSRRLPVFTRTVTGTLRFCEKCRHIKPDRCHHCSVCGACVLKMDHHCPWVNNCIGFSNYKFFLLFLLYAFLYCVYISLTSLPYFLMFWQQDGLKGASKFHILFVFFVASMFGVSLVSLFGYHCYLVLRNHSTLETFRAPIFPSGPDKHGFNMGRLNNFCEVFGDRRRFWLLPVFTSMGDGVNYRMRCTSGGGVYGATTVPATTVPATTDSFGDGVNYPQRHQDLDTDGLMGRQRWLEHAPDEQSCHSPTSNAAASKRHDEVHINMQ